MYRHPQITRTGRRGVDLHVDIPLLSETGILVAFSERTGGVSGAPYATLNLAAHVGDAPDSVDENRRKVLKAMGVAHLAPRLVTAEQVHGNRVQRIAEEHAGMGASAAKGPPPVPATDGLVTSLPDIPLMLLFADCVPIALALPDERSVAVLHAGWRGLLSGVIAEGVRVLTESSSAEAANVLAYVGPCIRGCCYEVGDEVVALFRQRHPSSIHRRRVDLVEAALGELEKAGVREQSVAFQGDCTYDACERFFSYRRSPETGRHAALVAVLGEGSRRAVKELL